MKTEFYILEGTGKNFKIITQSSKEDLRGSDQLIVSSSKDTIYYIGLNGDIDKREAIREVKKI